MTAGRPLARSTARRRSSTVSTIGWTMSSNSSSGNCVSSAWTSRLAVAPVASEIMCNSTTVTGRRVSALRPAIQGGELLSGGRALAERYLHGALVARSLDGEGDLVSGLLAVDRRAQVVAAVDRLAVDRGDHVSGLKAGVVGRGIGADLLQAGRALVFEADAEVGVVDGSVRDQL